MFVRARVSSSLSFASMALCSIGKRCEVRTPLQSPPSEFVRVLHSHEAHALILKANVLQHVSIFRVVMLITCDHELRLTRIECQGRSRLSLSIANVQFTKLLSSRVRFVTRVLLMRGADAQFPG